MTIPPGWKRARLGDLCSIEIGGTPSRSHSRYWDPAHDTSNVWVSIRDMRHRLIFTTAEQISTLGVKKSNVKLQPAGTVLLSFKLSIGRVAIAGVPLYTNEAIAGLAPRGLEREFLFHGLHGWDLLQGVDQAIKGATLNKQKLKKIALEYPESESEQAKIADILSSVDEAIEQAEALVIKQEHIKTGLIQDLLSNGIDDHGKLRSEKTHDYKKSSLGLIPSKWSVSAIGVEFDIQLGKMLSQESRRGRSPSPYLGNKNVQWDTANLSVLEHMDFDKRERAKFALLPGDILVCEGGDVGRTCLWRGEIVDCYYQKAIHRLRPKRGYRAALLPRFMRWAIGNGLLSDFTSRSSIAHLTKEKLAAVPISVPCDIEQRRICDMLDSIDDSIACKKAELAKLHSTKAGIMRDLLTGARRVTALVDERSAVMT